MKTKLMWLGVMIAGLIAVVPQAHAAWENASRTIEAVTDGQVALDVVGNIGWIAIAQWGTDTEAWVDGTVVVTPIEPAVVAQGGTNMALSINFGRGDKNSWQATTDSARFLDCTFSWDNGATTFADYFEGGTYRLSAFGPLVQGGSNNWSPLIEYIVDVTPVAVGVEHTVRAWVYGHDHGFWTRLDGNAFGTVNNYTQGTKLVTITFTPTNLDTIEVLFGGARLGETPEDLNFGVGAIALSLEPGFEPNFEPFGFDPADGEDLVPVDQVLTWLQNPYVAGMGVTYDVYFGTEPNELHPNFGLPLVKTTETDPSDFFFTPTLSPETTYYWHVVANEPNEPDPVVRHPGPLLQFETIPNEVVITEQPVVLPVSAGQTAVISLTALNATLYQWYKVGDTNPLANDGKFSGADTDTLTITDVQLGEEGYYYCVADNPLGNPKTSNAARLLTRRLMGWWKLDNDPNDSIVDLYPDAPRFGGQTAGDPNYVDGLDGKAIQLDGNNPDHLVNMSGSSEYYNFYPQGYTVSAWVKAPPVTAWGAFVSKEYAWNISQARNFYGYALYHNKTGQATFTQRRAVGDLGSGVQICNNNWYLVTGTWDPSDMRARVYVNGILRNTSSEQTQLPGVQNNPDDPELYIVRIGADADRYADQLGQNAPFKGLVDDVRIYSYPLSEAEVASLYYGGACKVIPQFDISGPDGTPDCKVNMYDLAEFAAEWLNPYLMDDFADLASEWLDCGLFDPGLCGN